MSMNWTKIYRFPKVRDDWQVSRGLEAYQSADDWETGFVLKKINPYIKEKGSVHKHLRFSL